MNRRHFISSCCAGMAASTVPLRVLGANGRCARRRVLGTSVSGRLKREALVGGIPVDSQRDL